MEKPARESEADLNVKMDLSIIIVNWNTRALLAQCLHTIYDSIQEITFEILVVDNGSLDGSAEMVRQNFPRVKLIENQENLGFARANNQSIQNSKGRYILLLNSDAFLQDNAVQQMVGFMDDHPEAGIAGANLIFPDGKPQISHSPLPTLFTEMMGLLGLDKILLGASSHDRNLPYIETGTVSGACLLARNSMLDQIGLLDERYFMFSEEVDLCHRACKAGWKVVHLPSAHVIHIGGGSTGQSVQRMLMLYNGKLQYFQKHYGNSHRFWLFTATRLATLIKIIIYSVTRWLGRNRDERDVFWRSVARDLGSLKV